MNSRRRALSLGTAGAAATLATMIAGSLAPNEAHAKDPAMALKKGKMVKLTLKLHRIGSKGKILATSVDLATVVQKLQSDGKFEVSIEAIVAPDMTEAVTISARDVVVAG